MQLDAPTIPVDPVIQGVPNIADKKQLEDSKEVGYEPRENPRRLNFLPQSVTI